MYSFDKNVVLDFSDVRYYANVHQILKKAFDFPAYYGENWDAFWDCMTDIAGMDGITVEIRGLRHLGEALPGMQTQLVQILQEWKGYFGKDGENWVHIYVIEGSHETELTAIVPDDH